MLDEVQLWSDSARRMRGSLDRGIVIRSRVSTLQSSFAISRLSLSSLSAGSYYKKRVISRPYAQAFVRRADTALNHTLLGIGIQRRAVSTTRSRTTILIAGRSAHGILPPDTGDAAKLRSG